MKKILIVLTLFITGSKLSLAQMLDRETSENNKFMLIANTKLEVLKSGNKIDSVLFDSLGNFVFTGISPGSHVLKASKAAYQDEVGLIVIKPEVPKNVKTPMQAAAGTAGEITVTQLSGTSIGIYDKYEAGIEIDNNFTNPYDPDEIRLDAVLTSPTGSQITVPCFYFQDFNIDDSKYGCARVDADYDDHWVEKKHHIHGGLDSHPMSWVVGHFK